MIQEKLTVIYYIIYLTFSPFKDLLQQLKDTTMHLAVKNWRQTIHKLSYSRLAKGSLAVRPPEAGVAAAARGGPPNLPNSILLLLLNAVALKALFGEEEAALNMGMEGEGVMRPAPVTAEGKDCEGERPLPKGDDVDAGKALEAGKRELPELETWGKPFAVDEKGEDMAEDVMATGDTADGKPAEEKGDPAGWPVGEGPKMASRLDTLPVLEETLPKREELPPGDVTRGGARPPTMLLVPRELRSEL